MSHSTFSFVAPLSTALAVVGLVAGWVTAADEPSPAPAATAPSAPQEPVSAERTGKLVKQLGDKDYYVRQRAQDELARLGFEAFDALSAATTDGDLEIASRAKYLLRLMRVEWTAEGDPPEVKRCLRDYEFEDGRSREGRMQALAMLPNGQGIAALCRLVRFEKSLLLSKTAAVALLSSQANDDPPDAATVEIVRKALSDCRRPGAVWLLAWTRLGSEPDAVMSEWTKLIGDEQALLQPEPPQVHESNLLADTTSEIIAGLTRFQITRLKRLGKTEEAIAAIQRLVQLERGNPETLAELLAWLTEQKAWKAVDDLAQRFKPQLAAEPGLLYLLAQAYSEQDEKDRAEETANRAFRLHPGKQQKELIHHAAAGQHLRNRGQIAWARREFEHVIQQGGDADNDELRVMAQSLLAEMLHDQGQDLDAAATLEKLVEAIDAGKVTENELNGRRANEIRARMDYFFACHWETKEDLAKRQECLDKALKADPADVDVLIACYRLPEQTPEDRANVIELIQKSAAETRELINQDPESPTSYNQFAWLIGNTEGDFDEALKFSLKSVELKPDEAGLYDTLARVYFAKGDLDNAVKNQTKAAELDRHSGLIQRQLDFFRKKQEEKKKP
jgi:tetratricopeptide (TPR) repeat protein